jgi:hypothetical protein
MTTSSPQAENHKGDFKLPDGRIISWVALVQMLMALDPSRTPDVGTVAAVFGDAKFKSLGEVAEAFQTHPSTVRKDWRSQGMPGSPEDGWPIGEIFRWRLTRLENHID